MEGAGRRHDAHAHGAARGDERGECGAARANAHLGFVRHILIRQVYRRQRLHSLFGCTGVDGHLLGRGCCLGVARGAVAKEGVEEEALESFHVVQLVALLLVLVVVLLLFVPHRQRRSMGHELDERLATSRAAHLVGLVDVGVKVHAANVAPPHLVAPSHPHPAQPAADLPVRPGEELLGRMHGRS